MNTIITIGREFGSGGRELGRRLAQLMNFAYYDQEIVTEIARRTSFSEQYVDAVTSKTPIIAAPISIGRSFSFYPASDPMMSQTTEIFSLQCKILKENAEKSNCVIVGRCADDILKEMHPFRIFVYADAKSKFQRCREKADENEHLSDKELTQKMANVDKQRSRYYAYYTGHKWGDRLNYDLCINTTAIDIKDAAAAIAKMLD